MTIYDDMRKLNTTTRTLAITSKPAAGPDRAGQEWDLAKITALHKGLLYMIITFIRCSKR